MEPQPIQARRELQKRLDLIRQDPSATISDAEGLIRTRSAQNYSKAAELLAELRDAVGGEEGSRIADQAASKIAKTNPTLRKLKRAFSLEGLNYR